MPTSDNFQSPTQAAGPQPSGAVTSPIVVARAQGITLCDKQSILECVKQLPLPGVVIFVHGVNSEGEWYKAAEEGLCQGLNRRLGRLDDQLAHHGIPGGQMSPLEYIDSLTADGFINPDMTAKNYIHPTPAFSPVIHFRWGYKANGEELKEFGDKIFLNEQDYWGGGPFANGCTTLPDLWSEGMSDQAFAWISAQGLNPTTRPLYRCPPRSYGVMAALRLARLIESIRTEQPDVPITVVCHSQGNIVGLTAAFIGDQLRSASQAAGCVADTYVLANAPYSLLNDDTFMDNWMQRDMRDSQGRKGRQTYEARTATLAAFFQILQQRKSFEPDAAKLDEEMANTRSAEAGRPYNAAQDRQDFGVGGNTYGRATLYSCPHDQVISALVVQGIGWRGMNAQEVALTQGAGVLTQRVFASGFTVGVQGVYRTWEDDWRYGQNTEVKGFWFPPSPPAKFSLSGAISGNENAAATLMTVLTAPVMYLITLVKKMPVNADPPKKWSVQIDAPALDNPFTPQAKRYGRVTLTIDGQAQSDFNENLDQPSAARNAQKTEQDLQADDAYDNNGKESELAPAQGDMGSEAAQRYEDRAILRMRARRTGNSEWLDEKGRAKGESNTGEMPEGYKAWQTKQIVEILKSGMENNPTNHSTIMTNADHAQHALAYDVAIGICQIAPEKMNEFRVEADWRFGEGLDVENKNSKYAEYFLSGKYKDDALNIWLQSDDPDAAMPSQIVDQREGGVYLTVPGAVV
ncbi:hypothetical protein [Comamonas sp. NoAH]|uniref:T6SS effector phospholipase Tle3 domain-containing protein n=1 Tax=Comamonas halotolerans TaxID=3041496 RepID=UPI0024E07FC8|nr:hypothetical protein [Comamonas sp. NoAH]